MIHLLKYLKPFRKWIFVIVLLLGIRAYCELSLPTYTSDIVNVGIQQGGISEKIPYYMRESLYKNVGDRLEHKDKAFWESAYRPSKHSSDSVQVVELSKSIRKNKEEIRELKRLFREFVLSTGSVSEMDESRILLQKIQEEYEAVGIPLEKKSRDYILEMGKLMLCLAGVAMMASLISGYLSARVAAGVGRTLRKAVFEKVVYFSNYELDHFSIASLITRSTNDIQQIQTSLSILLRILLFSPVMAIGGVLKVMHTKTNMTWIIGVGVGAILLVVTILFLLVLPKFQLVQKQIDGVNQVARELITGLSVVRVFGNEAYEEARFDKANRELTKTNLFVNRAMTFLFPMMFLIMNGVTILIVWIGSREISLGAMRVGDMMAFIQYTMQIIISFLLLCMISVMLPRAFVSANRIHEVLDSESLVQDLQVVKSFSTEKKGEVAFEEVSFSYPKAEEKALEKISFTSKKGEITAIIGSTGSGKSTLIKLIPRFYDVTEGRILVNGRDIREVSQKELREKIGYAPQKSVLFSGTIATNIGYGGDDSYMEEAAEVAQVKDFIQSEEEGYQREIGRGGDNVSGGQKQRISIARAIAKKPEIYLFDDSFSALDFKTDAALRKALRKEIKDSTVILVAQRIHTILDADQILVLEEGRVVGKGTHNELMKSCDTYYQIALSQLSEEELRSMEKEESV